MSTPLILAGAFARERRQRLTVDLGVMGERPQISRQLESSDSNGWCWDSRNSFFAIRTEYGGFLGHPRGESARGVEQVLRLDDLVDHVPL